MMRAEVFRPDDAMVKVIYGLYLMQSGRAKDAIAKLEAAREGDSQNANVNYNLGLAYAELRQYDKALESAHRAYEAGFPLPGLRNKLQRAGQWRDPHTQSVE
jgi:tetratricopeptide (TPR) repeat protein